MHVLITNTFSTPFYTSPNPRSQPPTVTTIMALNLYNTDTRTIYDVYHGAPVSTTPMSDEVHAFLCTPLELVYTFTEYTFAYDSIFMYNMFSFPINATMEISKYADFINFWNAQAIKYGQHTLNMSPDFTDASYVILTNLSCDKVHLWAGKSKNSYFGSWEPQETRRFPLMNFLNGYSYYEYHGNDMPILITKNTPVYEATAYLYRRKGREVTGDYYTKQEYVVLPAGMYKDMHTLVAIMNSNITLRGERNGYIYHFITDGRGTLGMEATHRQPEPSSVVFKPLLSDYGGCIQFNNAFNDEVTLPLRTSKRVYMACELPTVY